MQDILTSIKAYLYDRSVSPLIGAFIAAWTAWNYRFFIILLSEGLTTPADKFKEIDLLFAPYSFLIWNHNITISGRLIDGALAPAIVALIYLYLYPLIAKPVYEHSLNKQKELREIKQAQEDQRLLSVEESRELYRQLAQMQSKHQNEIDSLNSQISAQSSYIEKLESKKTTTDEFERDTTELDIDEDLEKRISKYDKHIAQAIEAHEMGEFHLNELFGQKQWSDIPAAERQALGKRFRKQVERGDFVGITPSGKSSGNMQRYFKRL